MGTLLLAAAVGLTALAAFPAHAAPTEGINLQISPLPIAVDAQPGKTITTELRIRNAGATPERLKVTLKKFRAEGDEGRVALTDRQPQDTHFDWVTFDRPTFTAPPNEWQTIKMTINVPRSAAFGYYYAVQFARANPAKAEPGKAAIEGAVAIFVLLDVKNPGAKRTAEVVEFSADKKVYEFLPATFRIKVKNAGNVHLAPRGNIFLTKGNNKLDPPIEVNATLGNVLPGSNRVYTAQWQDGFPVYAAVAGDEQALDDQGRPKQRLKWDLTQLTKLRFGKYTAKLVLVYDDGRRDVPIEGTVSFWVVPWRVIGVGLLVATFVLIGLWSTGRGAWAKARRPRRKR
ncbi:hypothetical protein KY386_03865 [Candidatus Parcubacteria bacterium]|nr:hypothetical protein [Candidatus Parcubacteria bacterium]